MSESAVTSPIPCPGNAQQMSRDSFPIFFAPACASTTSQQALEVSFPPKMPSNVPFRILPLPQGPQGCTPGLEVENPKQCGILATNALWDYNQRGQNLQPVYPGGPAYYNPLYPVSWPDWVSGEGVLASKSGASTVLRDPNRGNLTTYYFRTYFNVTNSACYTGLQLLFSLQEGALVYLNNVEILRLNMPAGPVTNATQALSRPLSTYSSTVTLGGDTVTLQEGTNFLALEVHAVSDAILSLKATATYNSSCSGQQSAPETCDGLDNDGDGYTDNKYYNSSELITRPCWTACGAGVQTCTRGAFVNCDAPPVRQEICNGIDDDCDGLVDNGPGQLDCPAGTACFSGQCQPVGPLTAPEQVWGPQTGPWQYLDSGASLDNYTSWKINVSTNAAGSGHIPWAVGSGAFGVYPSNTNITFNTPLVPNTKNNMTVRYFLRGFTLGPLDAAMTYAVQVAVRSCDGALVYLNGAELLRQNMPSGPVNASTLALQSAARTSTTSATAPNSITYTASPLTKASGALAAGGQNWVASELHSFSRSQKNWVFDVAVTRHVIQGCPSTSTQCVRYPPVDSLLVPRGDTWQFLDASQPLPPASWNKPGYDASSWLVGKSAFGQRNGTPLIYGNNRTTFYFRKTVSIPDGACFYNLTVDVLASQGGVVYFNGAEAVRFSMPAGNVSAISSALPGGPRVYQTVLLSTGWLVPGLNVISAEVHQAARMTNNTLFDIGISGRREAGVCTPDPL